MFLRVSDWQTCTAVTVACIAASRIEQDHAGMMATSKATMKILLQLLYLVAFSAVTKCCDGILIRGSSNLIYNPDSFSGISLECVGSNGTRLREDVIWTRNG